MCWHGLAVPTDEWVGHGVEEKKGKTRFGAHGVMNPVK